MTRIRREWWFAFGAVAAIGVLFRTLGYFDSSNCFWGDEGDWAVRFLTSSIWDLEKRPVAYAQLVKILVNFYDAEWVWRLPSYLGGIATLGIFLAIGRALAWQPLTILFVLLVSALSPRAIDLAKEFKPYSMELFIHALFVYLLIRAFVSAKRSARHYHWLMVLVPLLLPFAYNLAFVIPVVYGLAMCAKWPAKKRAHEQRWLRISFLATANVLVMLAMVLIGAISSNSMEYWGTKYGVFFLGKGWYNWVDWQLLKTTEVASFGVAPKVFWPLPAFIYIKLSAVLCFVALVSLLYRRRFELAAILFGPWALMAFASFFGHWPYAAFRTNLFIAAYTVVAAGVAVEELAVSAIGQYAAPAFVALWALGALPLHPSYFRTKNGDPKEIDFTGVTVSSRVCDVLLEIDRQNRALPGGPKRPLLIADWWMFGPLNYYLYHDRRYHRRLVYPTIGSRLYASDMGADQVANAAHQALLENNQQPTWVIYSNERLEKLGSYHRARKIEPMQCLDFAPQVLCRLR